LLLEWTDPPFSAGHWVPDLIAAGGGRPIEAHQGENSERLDWNAVEAAGADLVVVAPCGYHLGPTRDLAAELVATGRLASVPEVWAVDADAYFVRPGPRVVDGAELMGQILHPDRCGGPPPERAVPVKPA